MSQAVPQKASSISRAGKLGWPARMLGRLRARVAMPLLGKELVEQAARKRTYGMRLLYAIPLYAIVCFMVWERVNALRGNTLGIFGYGAAIFDALMVYQFAAIFLLLPALMAGTIAGEKERDSLVLLLVTGLRPFTIVMQKYLGRLLPMATMLLLGLPVMAMAYSLGGVDVATLAAGVIFLAVTVLQVGALGLMVSAYCRSTAGALIGTYVVGGLFYLLPGIITMALYLFSGARVNFDPEWWLSLFFPPGHFVEAAGGYGWSNFASMLSPLLNAAGITQPLLVTVTLALLHSIPPLLSTLTFLILARLFLVRRAHLPPSNPLLALFKKLDAAYRNANRLTGGVVLARHKATLPDDRPIAWWETTKRTLGQPQHLFRVLALLITPVVIVMAAHIAWPPHGRQQVEGISALILGYYALAALLLTIHSANTFAGDRRKQRLNLLLTMPRPTREIVLEKMAATRRLMLILAIPMAILIGLEAWSERHALDESLGRWMAMPLYLVFALAALAIYLPMIGWVALWIGMRVRHPTRAMLAAVGGMAIWLLALPMGVILIYETLMRGSFDFRTVEFFLSGGTPLFLLGAVEFELPVLFRMDRRGAWPIELWMMAFTLNLVLHLGVLLAFRALVLRRADRYLGRV